MPLKSHFGENDDAEWTAEGPESAEPLQEEIGLELQKFQAEVKTIVQRLSTNNPNALSGAAFSRLQDATFDIVGNVSQIRLLRSSIAEADGRCDWHASTIFRKQLILAIESEQDWTIDGEPARDQSVEQVKPSRIPTF